MATIEKAGVFVKDGKGNVGKLNGLTDNDVAKIQATMTTVDNITDDNGALPDATSTTKGVVLAADANTDVVQPSSGQQYALTTASTPQLVTVKDAQMITGEKSFTGGVLIDVSRLYVTSDAAFVSNNVSFMGSNITATSGAVDLSGAQAVHVPTASDTTDSSSYAASTEFVQNAIDAKAPDLSKYVTTDTEQTITKRKRFNGGIEMDGASFSTSVYGTSTSYPSASISAKTYVTGIGNAIGELEATGNATTVSFDKAASVSVPTVSYSATGSTKAASTAYVATYVATTLANDTSRVKTGSNSTIQSGVTTTVDGTLYLGSSGTLNGQYGTVQVKTQEATDSSINAASTAFVANNFLSNSSTNAQNLKSDIYQTGKLTVTGQLNTHTGLYSSGYLYTCNDNLRIDSQPSSTSKYMSLSGMSFSVTNGRVHLSSSTEVTVPSLDRKKFLSESYRSSFATDVSLLYGLLRYNVISSIGANSDTIETPQHVKFTSNGSVTTECKLTNNIFTRYGKSWSYIPIVDSHVLTQDFSNYWYGLGQDSSFATARRKIFRGADLLSSDHYGDLASLKNALYNEYIADICIGDYFTITADDTSYKCIVADILENGSSGSYGSQALVLLVSLGEYAMNTTATTAGGYLGSAMYTTYLPSFEEKFAGASDAPLYECLINDQCYLTNAVDSSLQSQGDPSWTGATTGVAMNYCKLTLLDEIEAKGYKNISSSRYDCYGLGYQLPFFALRPAVNDSLRVMPYARMTEIGYPYFWLRTVCNSTQFALACNPRINAYQAVPHNMDANSSQPVLARMIMVGKASS